MATKSTNPVDASRPDVAVSTTTPSTRVQKGTTMHKISLPTTALGLLLLVSPAYADDACSPKTTPDILTLGKDLADVGKTIASTYTSVQSEKYTGLLSGL
jgi:hypothetical protein